MSTQHARMTSSAEGEIVVFLIGMRVNRWWKFWQWLRTAMAMGGMLRELAEHPELGLVSSEAWLGRTTILVSYWKSTDHLLAYAKMRDAAHLPAWRAFNRLVGDRGDVGVWHETYRVPGGNYESVYVNMPSFGLGRVAGLQPATGRKSTAAGRLAPAPA